MAFQPNNDTPRGEADVPSPLRIILAPSGAGKSTYAHTKGPTFVVDGDSIVSHSIGWPSGQWWKDPILKKKTDAANELALREYALLHPDLVILFNGEVREAQGDKVALVLPDVNTIVSRIEARNKLGLRAANAADPKAIKANIAMLKQGHPEARVFSDFDDAFTHVRP